MIKKLEEESKRLQWESRKKWNPREARIARKRKAEIDEQLETLQDEKESLLEEKEELESRID